MSTTTDTTGATLPAETGSSAPAHSGNSSNRSRNTRRNANRRESRRTKNCSTSEVSKFKGTVKEMNGHVFQCHGETKIQNQFTRTLEELDSYVGLQFTHNPRDIKTMIKTMKDTVLAMPSDIPEGTKVSRTLERIWLKEIDMYVKQKETYKSNKVVLYSVVWSQCSEVMQARLKKCG